MGAPGTYYWMGSVLVYNTTSGAMSLYLDDDSGNVGFGSYLGNCAVALIQTVHRGFCCQLCGLGGLSCGESNHTPKVSANPTFPVPPASVHVAQTVVKQSTCMLLFFLSFPSTAVTHIEIKQLDLGTDMTRRLVFFSSYFTPIKSAQTAQRALLFLVRSN